MALPRPSCLRTSVQGLGRGAARRTVNQARSSPFRNAGRRTYASGHEAKQSSDLPWMIGSVLFTVPAATWLLGQAPEKQPHGDHGHGEEHEEPAEDSSQEEEAKDSTETEEKSDESNDESKDDSKTDSKDESEDDSKKDSKDESKDDAGDKKKADNAGEDEGTDEADDGASKDDDSAGSSGSSAKHPRAQYFRNPDTKPGERTANRPKTETKGEKDSASNSSGAKHPYLDDPEKSKKSHGPTETAKIHGTVKPRGHPDNQPPKKESKDDGDDEESKDDDKKEE